MPATKTWSRIAPPLKWHGGKHFLARKIVGLMPPHTHYVEPFAGGLSVLLAKDPEGVSEVVNDIDGDLSNFWVVLSSPLTFEHFRRLAEATPFSEPVYQHAVDELAEGVDDPVYRAWAFLIVCRQSLAGRMAGFTGITKSRTRRGMNNEVSAWLTAVEGLPAVHERLKRVLILSRDAVDVIRHEDGPNTLFYLDPPYLAATRTAPNVYRHEYAWEQHEELLDTIRGCRGKVMLSGYPSDLYEERLAGWARHDFDLPNQAAGGKSKRRMTESVWCNF